MPIPVTVFTGFLGSGKTTIILNLIKQLPKDYKTAWLKNEFGDVAVDSQLAKEANIDVTEMLNGCLCCVLVGKMGAALQELIKLHNPERVIVETSGSAYPAPIAIEIKKYPELVYLDSVVTVIDAINFDGYKDKGYTAEIQAQYTDLLLINKHEEVSDRKLEDTLDDVYELNPHTPKVKTDHGVVSPDLIFGLDTNLFTKEAEIKAANKNKNPHHHDSVEIIELRSDDVFDKQKFESLLRQLPQSDFYRIKGMVRFADGYQLLNYVFGRFDWQPLNKYSGETLVTFMGQELKTHAAAIKQGLGLSDDQLEVKH